jgi:hypothetical protein
LPTIIIESFPCSSFRQFPEQIGARHEADDFAFVQNHQAFDAALFID